MCVQNEPSLVSYPSNQWRQFFKSHHHVAAQIQIGVSSGAFTHVVTGVAWRPKIAMFPNVIFHACDIFARNTPDERHHASMAVDAADYMEYFKRVQCHWTGERFGRAYIKRGSVSSARNECRLGGFGKGQSCKCGRHNLPKAVS